MMNKIKVKYLLGVLILLSPFLFMSCQNEERPSERENDKCKVTAVLVHEDGTSETIKSDGLKSEVSKHGISISGLGTYDYNSKGAIWVKEEGNSSRKVDYITYAYEGGLYDYRYFPRTRQEYNNRVVTPPPHGATNSYFFPFTIKGDLHCSVFTREQVVTTEYRVSAKPSSLAFPSGVTTRRCEVKIEKRTVTDGIAGSWVNVNGSSYTLSTKPSWIRSMTKKSGSIIEFVSSANTTPATRSGSVTVTYRSSDGKVATTKINLAQAKGSDGVDVGLE